MSEEKLVTLLQAALKHHGIEDTILVAGQFQPRGTSGAFFAGGMIGDSIGGGFGQLGSAIGTTAGALGGAEAAAQASGMPKMMTVGASATAVYGMHARTRHTEPDRLVFAVPRKGLRAIVHQRGMVRVLELVDEESGTRIELEGSRLPVTHAKDVMDLLTGSGRQTP